VIARVLAQYQNLPPSQYFYSIVRLAICPFARLADFVPPRGRVLDVGCGFGLWLNVLALRYPELRLQGLDIDPRKIRGARRSRNSAIEFLETDTNALAAHGYDCITFVDVLYLMDEQAKQKAIAEVARLLKPGGILLIKEMDDQPRWKYAWNVFEETLAVRVVRMTHGAQLDFFSAQQQAQMVRAYGFEQVEIVRLDRGYLHPHVLVWGKKA